MPTRENPRSPPTCGRVIALLIGERLAQRIHVPKQYQVAVTNLFDHPSAQQLDVGRYLR